MPGNIDRLSFEQQKDRPESDPGPIILGFHGHLVSYSDQRPCSFTFDRGLSTLRYAFYVTL